MTILTEGKNTRHLKRWAELCFPEDVQVFEGNEGFTSDHELFLYGKLLGMVSTNTYFVVVWDCDADAKAQALREELPIGAKVTPYAFPKRCDNPIAQRGIENNYDESILRPYSTTTRRSDGSLLSQGFENRRKTEFADHVMREGTHEYFTNFQELRDIVSGILDVIETESIETS